jgi:peptide subunit release factor 1 (eRF1)
MAHSALDESAARLTRLGRLRAVDNTTSLISYWLRGGSSVDDARATIRRELGVAKKIKNRTHGRAMVHALTQLDDHLRSSVSRPVPESGLCVFVGQWV